jgi:large subunit ribosomal protein L23
MALFGRKKKEEVVEAAPKAAAPKAAKAKAAAPRAKKVVEKTAAPAAVSVKTGSLPASFDINQVIIAPRITEKSTMQIEVNNAYVFEITDKANKVSVSQAIQSLYKVTPVRVSIARTPGKIVNYRGRKGESAGVKKAYVYLKKGDKIELV